MRFVVRTGPGVVELNWMWLPVFCGQSTVLRQRIEKELAPELAGKELTDAVLDAASDRVIDIICTVHSALPGLRHYLDSIKFVEDKTVTA